MNNETQEKKQRGGRRAGAGRPKKGERTISVSVRLSPEAYEIYLSLNNKSEALDKLIKGMV